MSEFNPYIEDSDDRLAKLGQLQILLLFVASLVLFVRSFIVSQFKKRIVILVFRVVRFCGVVRF